MEKLDRSSFLTSFKDETDEHLRNLNKGILELENNPSNEQAMDNLLREIHTLKGAARMLDFNIIGRLAHGVEDVLDAVKRGNIEISSVSGLLFNGLDAINIVLNAELSGQNIELDIEELLHSLKEASEHPHKIEAKKRKKAKPVGEILLEDKAVTREQLDAALKKQKQSMLLELEETVRVSTSKLDSLANTVGEITINQVKSERYLNDMRELVDLVRKQNKVFKVINDGIKDIHEKSKGIVPDDLLMAIDRCKDSSAMLTEKSWSIYNQQQDATDAMGMIIDNIRNDVMALRLLPISTVFDLFPRTVHDLAKEYNKKVKLEISGAETELDKKMLEQVKDPLMHLLRNSVDHGIEPPNERSNIGKPKTGKISLSASHEGDRIIIRIADDGRGIDPIRTKAAAVEKGLINEDEALRLSGEDAQYLIFESGFSTKPSITDISGRGVGIDVVRKNIEDNLGGQITFRSEVNKGTEFTLSLPLTLAVMPSVLVRAGQQVFAIPDTSVKLCMQINQRDIKSVEGRDAIRVIDSTVPLVRLDEVLMLSTAASRQPQREKENSGSGGTLQVVVVEYAHKSITFLVDELIEEQNIIVKPLEEPLQKVTNVAGVTILDKGEVIPILNVPELINSATKYPVSTRTEKNESQSSEKRLKRILVVEDSLTTRELMRDILESVGYEVDTATDGLDALNQVFEKNVDIIVTDIQMPNMDGFEMTEKIKQDPKLRNIPVVMVTSLERDEEKRRGIEVGADAYIGKSDFEQSNLIDTLVRLGG